MTERAISLPFAFNSLGEISYTTDEKKIVQDRVTIAIMTRFGERVMRPNFGSTVHRALFENIDGAIDIINSAVTTCFATWLTELELISTDSTVNESDGSIEVSVEYKRGLVAESQTIRVKNALLSRSGEVIREV
jgi:phage baseplate assembly protein W